jgi:large subunit ribosomal protein L30
MRITWRKSAIGYAHDQKRTIRALGLKRLHDSIEHEDSPSIRGMTHKVKHLITIEELD